MSDSRDMSDIGDFRDFISRDQLVDAMVALSEDRAAAEAVADEAYTDVSSSVGIAGDIVSQLSLLSESSAERLRVMLGETEDEARADGGVSRQDASDATDSRVAPPQVRHEHTNHHATRRCAMRWLEIAVGADVAAIVATAVLFEPAASLG